MAEFRLLKSLRAKGMFWSVGALIAGSLATWIWMSSQAAWQAHLDRAFITGLATFETLRRGSDLPQGVTISRLPSDPDSRRENNALPKSADLPSPAFVTSLSILDPPSGVLSGTRLQIHIISRDLKYPIAKIKTIGKGHPAVRFGNITRLLASYCSAPIIFVRIGHDGWQRIDGNPVWGCQAAPTDTRLLAALIVLAALGVFLTQVSETSLQFSRFATALARRGRIGGPDIFAEEGPNELREIVRTVNNYQEIERDRLQKRMLILSGVSHDLGTPATRLRLRTALIEDDELRSKLETDIDRMTGMIQSVLTYTRSEMASEVPRQISLTSLVDSVVADYADTGKPVRLRPGQITEFDKSRSVFSGGSTQTTVPFEEARRVLVSARPISLQRAISNLIDNALKYGRRAEVSIKANSTTASIVIEDEGTNMTEETLNALKGPFLRGENSGFTEGVGLGLTIVSTIASQHGGRLKFERFSSGLRAILEISRH
jgi:signal transduction histidine kinase